MLVCWQQRFDWSFVRLVASVVTAISIMLAFDHCFVLVRQYFSIRLFSDVVLLCSAPLGVAAYY